MDIIPHILIHHNHITISQIINGCFAYFHKFKLMFIALLAAQPPSAPALRGLAKIGTSELIFD